MVFISICVGSSCHLKGSAQLIELLQSKIAKENLDDKIVLSGSFCLGKCNRIGVTVTVGDGVNEEVVTGVTPEEFDAFWKEKVISKLN